MNKPLDAASIVAQAEAAMKQAQLSLQRGEGFRKAHANRVAEWIAQSQQGLEEELRHFIFEQVSQAQQQQLVQAPVIESDAATRFARQVRRRRAIV